MVWLGSCILVFAEVLWNKSRRSCVGANAMLIIIFPRNFVDNFKNPSRNGFTFLEQGFFLLLGEQLPNFFYVVI